MKVHLISEFINVLKNEHTSLNEINNKKNIDYLKKYLNTLDATHIIEENNYVSKEYLDDFSRYYSKSFTDYSNKCKRLHFIQIKGKTIEEVENYIDEIILDNDINFKEFIKDCYLGYIVIKPIPYKIIGFTLLRPKTEDAIIFAKKEYKPHFFGNEFYIDSLPYQEQESLGACATVSIWVMFQMAIEDYSVIIKSPGLITKIAKGRKSQNKIFPSKNLTLPEICKAINTNNLQCEVRYLFDNIVNENDNDIRLNNVSILKKFIVAFSNLKIPLLLLTVFYNRNKNGSIEKYKNRIEGHAVSIVGYNFNFDKNIDFIEIENGIYKDIEKTNVFIHEFIDKIIVHDDQFGPFCEINFNETTGIINSLWEDLPKANNELQELDYLIIPTLKTIRNDLEDILDEFQDYKQYIFNVLEDGNYILDIKIMLSEEWRKEVKEDLIDTISNNNQKQLLLKIQKARLPKHIWIISILKIEVDNDANKNFNKVVNLIFDATESQSRFKLSNILFYNTNLRIKAEEKLFREYEEKNDHINIKELIINKFF